MSQHSLDTKGPEIRLRDFKDHKPVIINDGDEFTLTTKDVEGTEKDSVNYFAHLPLKMYL